MSPNCYCGSEQSFAVCCEPLHEGKAISTTAEQLMRSRYSAYACHNIDYILKTTFPTERKFYRRKEIEKWAKESDWLKLEIIFSSEKFVEFKAFYKDKSGTLQIHHEKSTFENVDREWYFLEAVD